MIAFRRTACLTLSVLLLAVIFGFDVSLDAVLSLPPAVLLCHLMLSWAYRQQPSSGHSSWKSHVRWPAWLVLVDYAVFLYIFKERLFDSIAYVLPLDPVRIPPIQTSITCTIPPSTIPRIKVFDPDLHRVSRSAGTFSCRRERTRRQREFIHCLAEAQRKNKLQRCCALSHAREISVPSLFSSWWAYRLRDFLLAMKNNHSIVLFFILFKSIKIKNRKMR